MLEIVVNATFQLQTMRRVVVIKVSQYDHEMPQSDITDNPHIGVEETQKLTATWYQEDYLRCLTMLEIVVIATLQLQTMRKVFVKKRKSV